MDFTFEDVIEKRDIKITAKRQITIPKTFYEHLGLDAIEKVQAYLLGNAILLKAEKEDTVVSEDYMRIVQKLLAEGLTGDDFIKELSKRIKKYDEFMEKRIEEFTYALEGSENDDLDEGEDLNGLEVFLHEEDGEDTEEATEEK